jgi:hypothetical protein
MAHCNCGIVRCDAVAALHQARGELAGPSGAANESAGTRPLQWAACFTFLFTVIGAAVGFGNVSGSA